MKKLLAIMALSVGLLANAQTVDLLKPAKDIALRAPSVPIIVSDPYFSIWSPYDKLMEGSTEHWTSAKKPLLGALRVDGKVYRFLGKDKINLDYLKETVRTVYKCLRKTEQYMAIQYDYIDLILPKEIFFITSQELEDLFPDNTPKEREYYITKAKGAVCIMQIGDTLESGEPHDGRAPDYDDWALNADILVYYPVLDIALELSSKIGRAHV